MKLISEGVDVIRGRRADGLRVQSSSKDHRVDDLHITVRKTFMQYEIMQQTLEEKRKSNMLEA